jgi:hypothetical protein
MRSSLTATIAKTRPKKNLHCAGAVVLSLLAKPKCSSVVVHTMYYIVAAGTLFAFYDQ